MKLKERRPMTANFETSKYSSNTFYTDQKSKHNKRAQSAGRSVVTYGSQKFNFLFKEDIFDENH